MAVAMTFPQAGKIVALTGPSGCGKSRFLTKLAASHIHDRIRWLMPAMELSTDEARSLGAYTASDVFTWPTSALPSLVLVDEPDRAMEAGTEALRYRDMLRYLCAHGHSVVVVTHSEDVVDISHKLIELGSGGILPRRQSALWWDAQLAQQGFKLEGMTDTQLCESWKAWPFIDTMQGAGMIFDMVVPGCELATAWVLIEDEIHEQTRSK